MMSLTPYLLELEQQCRHPDDAGSVGIGVLGLMTLISHVRELEATNTRLVARCSEETRRADDMHGKALALADFNICIKNERDIAIKRAEKAEGT